MAALQLISNVTTSDQLENSRLWSSGAPLRIAFFGGDKRVPNYLNLDTAEYRGVPVADAVCQDLSFRFLPRSIHEILILSGFERYDAATAMAFLVACGTWMAEGARLTIEVPHGHWKFAPSSSQPLGWNRLIFEAIFARIGGAIEYYAEPIANGQRRVVVSGCFKGQQYSASEVFSLYDRYLHELFPQLGFLTPEQVAPFQARFMACLEKWQISTAPPVISVFVPVKNCEQHLPRALESLRTQQFKEFEVLVVDDCSSDRSAQIALDYAQRDARFRLLKQHYPIGLTASRNVAWRSAHGLSQFGMHHSPGDESLPEKLLKLHSYLELNYDIAAVGSFVRRTDNSNSGYEIIRLEQDPERIHDTFAESNQMLLSATLVRRELYQILHGFDTKSANDEYDFWSRALQMGHRLANVPEVLHVQEQADSSRSSSGAASNLLMTGYAGYLESRRQRVARRRAVDEKSLRILHSVEYYAPHVGGAELVVQKVSEKLVQRGHQVTVATQFLPERDQFELNGVRIEHFCVRGSSGAGILGLDKGRYKRFLREFQCDVMMNYAAQQWASDLAFEVLPDISQGRANILFPCGYSALSDAKTVRWEQFESYYRDDLPRALPLYDAVVCHSKMYQDYEFGALHGLTNQYAIPNGVEESEFLNPPQLNFREKYGIRDKHILLCVANFCEFKGHEQVIEAFRALNRADTVLVLIGKSGGSEIPAITAKIAGLNVKMLVGIPRQDTLAAFKAADLFVFGSQIEASPLVIIEAKASKLPFVSTDVGNVREWKGGVVCDRKDMAIKIARLLDSPGDRQRLAEEGYREWSEKLTWSAVVDRYEELYRRFALAKARAAGRSPVEPIASYIEISREQSKGQHSSPVVSSSAEVSPLGNSQGVVLAEFIPRGAWRLQ